MVIFRHTLISSNSCSSDEKEEQSYHEDHALTLILKPCNAIKGSFYDRRKLYMIEPDNFQVYGNDTNWKLQLIGIY